MSKGFAEGIQEIWLVPGFHSDVVWLDDQRDYTEVLLGDLKQNLAVCKVDPDYGFFVHELTYLKPYLAVHPEDRELLRELIKRGRVGTGGSHSQPSEPLIGPEGLIRNILYGKVYHRDMLGDDPVIYMGWDIFGHSIQLGQILRKAGFKGALWSKDIRGAEPVFWHLSLDGEALLFRRTNYGILKSGIEDELLGHLMAHSHELASLGFTSDLRLDALDFKPPTAWMIGRCGELKARNPRILVSGTGHEQWFRKTLTEIEEKKLPVPVTARDFEWHHQGTGLTRIDFKIANRFGENTLINAEKFATLASYLGAAYPDKALDKAWRQLLLNQHHDGMTGPCCDRSYVDLLLAYREALELGQEVLDNSLTYLGEQIDTQSAVAGENSAAGIPFAVFNPVNWSRSDICKAKLSFPRALRAFQIVDQDGKPVSFELLSAERTANGITAAEILVYVSSVPSLGYATYYAVPSLEPMPVANVSQGNTIENEFFRITVDPAMGGGIVSLYDKTARRELMQTENGVCTKPGNELIRLAEDPARKEPPWEIFTTGERVFSRDFRAEVEIQKGPLLSKLSIRGEVGDQTYTQAILLYQGVRRIEFMTELDEYNGVDEILSVAFPVDVKGLEPVFEERFGTLVKRKSKGYLDFQTWQWRNYSNCGARRAYQWFGLEQSGVIACGSSDDADHVEKAFGMVGLVTGHNPRARAVGYDLEQALIRRGIPVTPFYDDLEQERRCELPAEDSCMPKESLDEDLPWGTSFRIALDVAGDNRYAQGLLAMISPEAKARYDQQLAEQGHGYLLLNDSSPADAGWPALPVLLVSGENDEALAAAVRTLIDQLATGRVELPVGCNATEETGSIDDYGVALLNHGNVLGSVEHDNTMVLFLMHTAAWGITPWGQDRLPFAFVPEWKTHRFTYALYPHTDDWRSAQVVQAGYDYNSPLMAKQLTINPGSLPLSQSFLKVDGSSVVITAMKPKGYGLGKVSGKTVTAEAGIVLRAYETAGQGRNVKFKFFRPLAGAESVNLLEEHQASLAVESSNTVGYRFNPFSIETLCLTPSSLGAMSSHRRQLGSTRELAQPVYVRYWEHNVGADPIGYAPVSVTISGEIQTEVAIPQSGVSVNTVQVGVTNDYCDTAVQGEVAIIAPAGWKAVPQRIPYNLEPGEHLLKEIVLGFVGSASLEDGILSYPVSPTQGIIRAQLVHDGQLYEDILEFGDKSSLHWEAHCRGNEIIIQVENPNSDSISGEVFICSPMETWPEEQVDILSRGVVTPRSQVFNLEGHNRGEYKFQVPWKASKRELGEAWVVAKIAYHGQVEYRPVLGRACGSIE